MNNGLWGDYMDTKKKVLVGYDFCEDITQISCYSYKALEPISICVSDDASETGIPTVLCVRYDNGLWLYGEEAVRCAEAEEGILIDTLLTKLQTGQSVNVNNIIYSPTVLLEKYFRKTLMLVKNHFPTEQITMIAVTVNEMDTVIVKGIYNALEQMGIFKDRAVVISHASAYLYYALSQNKSLWMNDVGLFDFNKKKFCYYQISINRRVNPMIAGLKKIDFTDRLNYDILKEEGANVSYIFENIANMALHKQIVSTLYFTGRDFEEDWAMEAIEKLCIGRRAFVGQNLYTKGACYGAKGLSGDSKLDDFILLNDDMITSSIALRSYVDARIRDVVLIDAAIPWYEAKKSVEIILDDEQIMEIVLHNIMTRETIREKLILNNLPQRPNKMTRLELQIHCTNRSTAIVRVKDLGFGDIYPPTTNNWEFQLDI